nr:reverse transcriptase domain-containing protein [Tanacetum cinerariifolium]
MDEIIRVTTYFLRGEVAASNHERKKSFPSPNGQKQLENCSYKITYDQNRIVSKSLKDIQSSIEIGGMKLAETKVVDRAVVVPGIVSEVPSVPVKAAAEKGHNTNEYMHLKKQIEEMLKAGKLSHLIKELKQNNRKEQSKTANKGETQGKEKPLAILMVQPWERVARQKITQSFSSNPEIFFPPLGEDEGIEGPMIIEAEIRAITSTACNMANRANTTTVTIRDEEHSASAWMNSVVIRPGVRKLQAVSSTAHRMLKIPVERGIITLKSSMLVPLECVMVSGPEKYPSATKLIVEERVNVAINPKYLEQTIMIGSTLTEEGRNKLCNLLQHNLDIFAWMPADMTGIPRHIAKHCLNEGMCLGYKVNTKGLKVCPDKVDEVLNLPSPKCLKDVQKLNGKLASLNRFLAKSAEKSLPFFKTLKKCTKKSDFLWTMESKEEFKQIKQLMVELPMIIAPMEKAKLIVYLATTKETRSSVLMTEKEAKQMPIYFVSRALRGPELNYTSMEKLVLALMHTNGFGAGLILTNPKGVEFTYALRFRFDATNNEAEYEALIARIRIAEQMGVKNLQANVDSHLVANQVNETYVAKEVEMIRYLEKVVIPAEIGMPTLRTAEVDLVQNNEALEINLDLLEERREEAAIREAKSKAKMEKYYNSKV